MKKKRINKTWWRKGNPVVHCTHLTSLQCLHRQWCQVRRLLWRQGQRSCLEHGDVMPRLLCGLPHTNREAEIENESVSRAEDSGGGSARGMINCTSGCTAVEVIELQNRPVTSLLSLPLVSFHLSHFLILFCQFWWPEGLHQAFWCYHGNCCPHWGSW